jgi:hypothetical protein
MTISLGVSRTSRTWLLATTIGVLGAVLLAYGRAGGEPTQNAQNRTKLEYVSQEVQADGLVQTLNDLDGQGWDVFQVVPHWTIKNENNETAFVPKSYQIFGRRPKAK